MSNKSKLITNLQTPRLHSHRLTELRCGTDVLCLALELFSMFVFPVSEVTTAALSVWLSCFRKILIISPPSLLASALIDWQTCAGTESERWLKWRNKTERRKEQNRLIEFINVKAWVPPPSSINHSVSFLFFIICSHTLSLQFGLSFDLTPSISAFWVMRDLNLTGYFQGNTLDQSTAKTIVLNYMIWMGVRI